MRCSAIAGEMAMLRQLLNTQLHLRSYKGGSNPLAHGIHSAAVQALRHGKLGRTVWTDSPGLERVEWLPAPPALPEVPDRRCCFAPRTDKPVPTRQLCETRQRLGMPQSAPAIHEHEDGEHSEPDGMDPHGEDDEPGHAEEADDRGHHQAAGAA